MRHTWVEFAEPGKRDHVEGFTTPHPGPLPVEGRGRARPLDMERAALKTIPKALDVAGMIRDGFHQCVKCRCCETFREPDTGTLLCKRCSSEHLKWVPGINAEALSGRGAEGEGK